MKLKIFATLLFLVIAFGFQKEAKSQDAVETFFAVGDTTETFNVPAGANKIFITVVDSSVAGTDTIWAQIKISGGVVTSYSPLAVRNANATAPTTYVTSMIPGDNTAGTYQFDAKEIPGATFRVYRSNVSTNNAYAPRTRITVSFK